MKNKFLSLIKKHESNLKKDKFSFAIVGYAKLILVVLMGFFIYLMFTKKFPLELIILFVATFVILAVLWVYHNRLHDKVNYSKGIISICSRHLDRISDIGSEFINSEHPYSSDLDIVGKKSFFQFLNTTHTWHGRQAFANDLLQSRFTKEELMNRQKAIAELCKDIDFSNDIEYCFSKIGVDGSAQKLVEELKDRHMFIKSKVIKFLIMYVPMLTFISIIAIVVSGQKILYMTAASVAVLQTIIWVIGIPKTQRYLAAI